MMNISRVPEPSSLISLRLEGKKENMQARIKKYEHFQLNIIIKRVVKLFSKDIMGLYLKK